MSGTDLHIRPGLRAYIAECLILKILETRRCLGGSVAEVVIGVVTDVRVWR